MSSTEHSAQPARLVRAMGTWALAASVVNLTVGGGIFLLPADVAGSMGTAAPVAYLVCAVAMGLIVLCFADAGSRVDMTGGPYAYVEVAFGPLVGFVTGVLLWMMGTLAFAAVAVVFVEALGALVPALAGAAARSAVLVATFAGLTMLNIRGVKEGVALNSVATVAKLLPLLLLAAVGVFFIRPAELVMTEPLEAGTLARTSILLIFAFAGLETALMPSGEVRDVPRTVPRALLLAMLGITALYVALHLVGQGVLGEALAASKSPWPTRRARCWGRGGARSSWRAPRCRPSAT